MNRDTAIAELTSLTNSGAHFLSSLFEVSYKSGISADKLLVSYDRRNKRAAMPKYTK